MRMPWEVHRRHWRSGLTNAATAGPAAAEVYILVLETGVARSRDEGAVEESTPERAAR